jgi:hypothetical protein
MHDSLPGQFDTPEDPDVCLYHVNAGDATVFVYWMRIYKIFLNLQK